MEGDVVVLDRDICACKGWEIAEARVVLTMVGGKVVWGGEGF